MWVFYIVPAPSKDLLMLRTEKVSTIDWYKEVREINKRLDETNIKILTAMWKYGPRNLLEVSRRTRIPFTSVYHRVAKLSDKAKHFVYLMPQVSRLSLVRIVVLAAASPGREASVTAALKLPNIWSSVNLCEGAYTHLSINYVPEKFVKEFRTYIRRLSELRLVTSTSVILTGELYPNFPNFTCYNSSSHQWKFDWTTWLKAARKKPTKIIEDPKSYALSANGKDLLIIRELQKNARMSFADLAPMLGISLQGVKYHFDKKLVPSGIVSNYVFEVLPYPVDVSASHEVILRFTNNAAMNKFYSIISQLFFVQGVTKVLRQNTLIVRTYVLQKQLANMFALLSELAKERSLESYTSVRLDLLHKEAQTIPCELFDDHAGWTFDLKRCLKELTKVARRA